MYFVILLQFIAVSGVDALKLCKLQKITAMWCKVWNYFIQSLYHTSAATFAFSNISPVKSNQSQRSPCLLYITHSFGTAIIKPVSYAVLTNLFSNLIFTLQVATCRDDVCCCSKEVCLHLWQQWYRTSLLKKPSTSEQIRVFTLPFPSCICGKWLVALDTVFMKIKF